MGADILKEILRIVTGIFNVSVKKCDSVFLIETNADALGFESILC
jgi:hypothetical protein